MDDPRLASADHMHALTALARINTVSRTAVQMAADVGSLLEGCPSPATVVDVACGGGDVTIGLARRLSRGRAGNGVRVVGIDISPRAVERARQAATDRGSDVAFEVRDVLAGDCPPCDVAVSSLFLHHLDDDDARRLLRGMAGSARRGVVVSDLVRSRLGYGLAVVGTTLLSSSRVVRVDGPLSVRAARTPREYEALCEAAGLGRVAIRRVWPERVMIRWRRPVGEHS